MWQVVAEDGSPGRVRVAVWVEVMRAPLGRWTWSPGVTGMAQEWGPVTMR
mgnify:FL=1